MAGHRSDGPLEQKHNIVLVCEADDKQGVKRCARLACATLMYLQGVAIAVVAAWLGHNDVSCTLRTYVPAQAGALELAARSFALPISSVSD
jgi:integrase